MDFLGVGPGELFLILILMLVVLGPERLPVFARQAGRLVVSVRDWIQRSPDAQMMIRVREELEDEMVSLRTSLAQEVQSVREEMQTVREEVIDAARTPVAAIDSLPDFANAPATIPEPANTIAASTPESPADDLDTFQPVPRSGRPGAPIPEPETDPVDALPSGTPAVMEATITPTTTNNPGETAPTLPGFTEFAEELQSLRDELATIRRTSAVDPILQQEVQSLREELASIKALLARQSLPDQHATPQVQEVS